MPRRVVKPAPLSGRVRSGGSRLCCIESMPAGGAETERLHPLLRDLGRVELREPDRLHASRAKVREQLLQTGSTIVDERAERYNLRLLHSSLHVKEVGFDSLVGGDGEPCDLVLLCNQALDLS